LFAAASVVGCDEERERRCGAVDEDEFVVVDVDRAVVVERVLGKLSEQVFAGRLVDRGVDLLTQALCE
jgi:hypothetical protein